MCYLMFWLDGKPVGKIVKNRLNATLLVRSNIKTLIEEGLKTCIHAMRNGWKPPPPLLKKTNQTLSYKFYVFKSVQCTLNLLKILSTYRGLYTIQYSMYTYWFILKNTVHCKKTTNGAHWAHRSLLRNYVHYEYILYI